MESKMSSAYNPADIETRIQKYWQGKFVAPDAPQGETFSDLTLKLHMLYLSHLHLVPELQC